MAGGALLEIEVKVPVAGLASVRRKLRELGAKPGRVETQSDVYFAHPGRDLAASDEVLRLRTVGGRHELTYKGPKKQAKGQRRGAGAKVRSEETVHLVQDPTRLLVALGFQPVWRLRKRRQSFRLARVEVSLDRVDGVATFVEVEVVGRNVAAATRQVEAALAKLGLQGARRESRSYLALALAVGAAAATRP